MNRSIEMKCPKRHRSCAVHAIAVGVFFGGFVTSQQALAVDPTGATAASPQQQEQRLELMKSKGAAATPDHFPSTSGSANRSTESQKSLVHSLSSRD